MLLEQHYVFMYAAVKGNTTRKKSARVCQQQCAVQVFTRTWQLAGVNGRDQHNDQLNILTFSLHVQVVGKGKGGL